MKFPVNLATLLVLAALPLVAISAEPSPLPAKEEPAPLFDQLDVNHDGYLTREEAKTSTAVIARFKEIDMDRDGRISEAEFKKVMQPKLAPKP